MPGMLQAQGYGKPIFTNIKYPFPANEPFIRQGRHDQGRQSLRTSGVLSEGLLLARAHPAKIV
jgi:hypothetical protein